MIRLTFEDGPPFRLRVEGRLDRHALGEFERACGRARAGPLHLDLQQVTFLDAAGAGAVRDALAHGAVLARASPFVHELLRAPAETGARLREPAAQEHAVRRHAGPLLALCRRLVGEAQAHRAVQDAFVATFAAAGCPDDACLLACLRRRAVHGALAAATAGPTLAPEDVPSYTADGHRSGGCAEWTASCAEMVARHGRSIRSRIGALPTPLRAALVLHDVEGWGAAEVAAALGVSVAMAKRRVHRARMALREAIDREVAANGAEPGARRDP